MTAMISLDNEQLFISNLSDIPWGERSCVGGPATLEAYLDYCRNRGLRPASISAYRKVLRIASRDLDLATTTEREIEKWLDEQGLSASSRNSYLSAIKSFYRYALRVDLLDHDPTIRLDRSLQPRRLPRPIAPEDLSRALFAADVRMRLVLCLGAYGGLRRGEMTWLRGTDIDLSNKSLRISGKGGHERVIPLADTTQSALLAFGLHPDRLLPITSDYLGTHVRLFFESLGMPYTCHQLRHTFATMVYAKTHDLRLVQELLGHSSVATTQIYAALTPSEKATNVVRNLGV